MKSARWHARRVRDWRPEPPTPRSKQLPLGWRSTRLMRHTCEMASAKSTRFIGTFISLYSPSDSFIFCESLVRSVTSS